MTIWAAKGSFEEDIKGSIEPGKFADFVILEKDIMEIEIDNVPNVKVISTWLAGERVFFQEQFYVSIANNYFCFEINSLMSFFFEGFANATANIAPPITNTSRNYPI